MKSFFLPVVSGVLVFSGTLFANKVGVDEKFDRENTLLHYVVSSQEKSIGAINALIKSGVNINEKNEYGRTPLHLAAKGRHDTVRRLLENDKIDMEAKDNDGKTPLLTAAYDGSSSAIFLLMSRSDVRAKDKYGSTFLHALASNRKLRHELDWRPTEKLIKEKVLDVNAKESAHQETPLHMAARRGNVNFAATLIRNGADVNARNEYGGTPLHSVAYKGKRYVKMAELLIENGANVNATDHRGETPIFISARYGGANLFKLLHKKGARLDVVNSRGQTILDWTINNGEIKNILIREGVLFSE